LRKIIKLGRTVATYFRNFFAPLPWSVLLGIALPYAVAISMITSVGGTLQYAVAHFLSSDAPSLYAAVFEEAINRKLTLGTWLIYGFAWPWIAIGCITALVSVRQRQLGRAIITSCWLLPVTITTSDIVHGVIDGVTLTDHMQNLVANFIGGPVAALLAVPALLLLLIIPRWMGSPTLLAVIVAQLSAVAWGAAVCALAFLGYSFLFVPVSQKLELVLAQPVSGMSFAPVSLEGPKPQNKLSFLPKGDVDGTASITAPGGNLTARWQSLRGESYTASIQILVDCVSQDIAQLPAGSPALVRRGIGLVSAKVSEGHSELKLAGGRARYLYAPKMPTSYWIDPVGKDKVKIAHFVSPEDPIDIEVSSDAAILISNGAIRYRKGLGYPSRRTLSLMLGSERIIFKFPKPEMRASSRPLQCRTAKSVESARNGSFTIRDGAIYGAILLRFTSEAPPRAYASHDAKLHVAGANGWFGVSDIPIDQLGNDELGATGFLSSIGAAEVFRLDGIDAQITKHDTLLSVGVLKPRYMADGKLHITGVASQMWRGEQRLSPTKWERLPLEVKLALAALLLSIGGLFEFCRRIVRKYTDDDVATAFV
jgi:hypothetical protein